MKTLFNNFLRGLLLVAPLAVTLYIIIASVGWANEKFNSLLFHPFGLDIPGLGILAVFLSVSLLGWLASTAFSRPLISFFESMIARTPIVKFLYTSIKEVTEAFLGDRKRFNRPVIAEINEKGVKRIGFITQDNLDRLGLEGYVAVYCPHSYNFSGNFYLVPAGHVTPLDANPTDVMKFIVSGGVTHLNEP